MFAERFDALMNIAEISNSQLGRDVNMNPSHIGRLRSGARPLAKKHDYLADMCRYLARHIKKDYQLNALQKLTGINGSIACSKDCAAFLLQWLTEGKSDRGSAAERLLMGFSSLASAGSPTPSAYASTEAPGSYAAYLYSNEGKRKGVEQFFLKILQETRPQTLLLFSDENMEWLYEDPVFAKRWGDLFLRVLMAGNKVKIIHTVTRDINDMLVALEKWVPIYMTGMIEPYYYPRLRDGLFRRTMFIAPETAALLSSSIQQSTDGMLNLFITDKAALEALTDEFQGFLNLCRSLIHIYKEKDRADYEKAFDKIKAAEGSFRQSDIVPGMTVYVKEDVGAVLTKVDAPMAAFIIEEKRLVSALWDYLRNQK